MAFLLPTLDIYHSFYSARHTAGVALALGDVYIMAKKQRQSAYQQRIKYRCSIKAPAAYLKGYQRAINQAYQRLSAKTK